jgi:hypothetical protein
MPAAATNTTRERADLHIMIKLLWNPSALAMPAVQLGGLQVTRMACKQLCGEKRLLFVVGS